MIKYILVSLAVLLAILGIYSYTRETSSINGSTIEYQHKRKNIQKIRTLNTDTHEINKTVSIKPSGKASSEIMPNLINRQVEIVNYESKDITLESDEYYPNKDKTDNNIFDSVKAIEKNEKLIISEFLSHEGDSIVYEEDDITSEDDEYYPDRNKTDNKVFDSDMEIKKNEEVIISDFLDLDEGKEPTNYEKNDISSSKL